MSFTMLSAGFIIPTRPLPQICLGAPVPALPAVGVPHLLGEAAQLVQKQGGAAMGGMDELALPVPVSLHQDGQRAIGVRDPLHLVRHQSGRLVPGDAYVFALAPVLGIALPVRVPVHPFERVLDPVGGIHPFLIGKAPRRRNGLEQRLEGLAVLGHLPGVEGGGVVFGVEVEGPYPDHLAVLDVDGAGNGAVDATAEAQGLEDRPLPVLRGSWLLGVCSDWVCDSSLPDAILSPLLDQLGLYFKLHPRIYDSPTPIQHTCRAETPRAESPVLPEAAPRTSSWAGGRRPVTADDQADPSFPGSLVAVMPEGYPPG